MNQPISTKLTKKDLILLNDHIIENFNEEESNHPQLEVDKNIYWVDGFLCSTTLSNTEESFSMDSCLSTISGECTLDSEDYFNSTLSIIFRLKNQISKELNKKNFKPLYYKYNNITSQTSNEMAISWSKGFMYGLLLFLPDILFDKDDNQEVVKILGPILFASTNFFTEIIIFDESRSISVNESESSSAVDVKEKLSYIPKSANMFDLFIRDRDQYYSNINDFIHTSLPLSANENIKIGRNELCPCGSGKKYKKCCMDFDRN